MIPPAGYLTEVRELCTAAGALIHGYVPADLMARMTLEEKVAQLLSLWGNKGEVQDAQNRALLGVYDFSGGAMRYLRLLRGWLSAACEGDLLMCHPGRAIAQGELLDLGPVVGVRRWPPETQPPVQPAVGEIDEVGVGRRVAQARPGGAGVHGGEQHVDKQRQLAIAHRGSPAGRGRPGRS